MLSLVFWRVKHLNECKDPSGFNECVSSCGCQGFKFLKRPRYQTQAGTFTFPHTELFASNSVINLKRIWLRCGRDDIRHLSHQFILQQLIQTAQHNADVSHLWKLLILHVTPHQEQAGPGRPAWPMKYSYEDVLKHICIYLKSLCLNNGVWHRRRVSLKSITLLT